MKKSINFFVGATLVLALLLVGQSELFAKAKPLPHTFDKDGAGIIVKGAQEVVVRKSQPTKIGGQSFYHYCLIE